MNSSIRISILSSLGLLLLAQLIYLPVLLSIIFIIILISLYFSLQPGRQPIAKYWTFSLIALALLSIYLQYRAFIGVEAGVAVLSTFLFAKALETRTRRDVIILFNFALFVSASSFLFSQSIWMAFMVILSLLSCLIGLYRLQTSEFEYQASAVQALKRDARHVGRFVLYALPFFVLLFMFFPRLPPLWHIPIPENKGITGISDSMSPGDIAELSQSSALAFRIIGDVQQLPPRHELYWRAMVLDEYDGQRWRSSFVNQQPLMRSDVLQPAHARSFDYQYLAADPGVRWVMGLEKSVPLERRYYSQQDWGIVPRRLTQRVEPIPLRWIGDIQTQTVSNAHLNLRINTQFPVQQDLQAQQLAQRLFLHSGQDPERYVQQVLRWYRENGFVYTLTPGRLGQHRVDEFLFQSRQGFCEHYASSFVMLMRYVGIPARVVTGYQGGELAPDGKSWEVRQLDAHAWTEVLLNGKWQRFDPTAMISPQRVEQGMQNLIAEDQAVLGERGSGWTYRHYHLMNKLRIWSDYASYQWQSKVVGYNAESQRGWLAKLGLHSSYANILMLILTILGLLGLYMAWLYYQHLRRQPKLAQLLQTFSKPLPPELQKKPAETFNMWMSRLAAQAESQQHHVFKQTVQLYEQMQYASEQVSEADLKKFKALLNSCASALKNHRKGLS